MSRYIHNSEFDPDLKKIGLISVIIRSKAILNRQYYCGSPNPSTDCRQDTERKSKYSKTQHCDAIMPKIEKQNIRCHRQTIAPAMPGCLEWRLLRKFRIHNGACLGQFEFNLIFMLFTQAKCRQSDAVYRIKNI